MKEIVATRPVRYEGYIVLLRLYFRIRYDLQGESLFRVIALFGFIVKKFNLHDRFISV